MTKEEALASVEKIREEADDDEVAHSHEDGLRAQFIAHVAEMPGELGELAKIVLSTDEISFGRWCA
ncbi:MAG: hypothetical protein WC935_00130 [Thermoleophilia bacterium]